jgi:hypothetical protein
VGHTDKGRKSSGTINAKASERATNDGNAHKDFGEQSKAVAVNDGAKQHNGGCVQDVCDTQRSGLPGSGGAKQSLNSAQKGDWKTDQSLCGMGWPTQPPIRRGNDGLPGGLVSSRLAALGNAVVPQIPEMIGYAILEAEHGKA